MDRYPPDHFATIIQIAQTTFTHVVANIDMTPSRTLVRIQAQYGRYRVFITELMDQTTRKYRYYILDNHIVAVGFDNSPDPRALRIKYGRIGKEHAGEYLPHMHLANKTQLFLTEEVQFPDFITWLHQNLPITESKE